MRLTGKTNDNRECVCEFTVYADGDLEGEVDKAATTGPWYYKETAEEVPDGSQITVEHVVWLNERDYK
jgi:hypothetical protein